MKKKFLSMLFCMVSIFLHGQNDSFTVFNELRKTCDQRFGVLNIFSQRASMLSVISQLNQSCEKQEENKLAIYLDDLECLAVDITNMLRYDQIPLLHLFRFLKQSSLLNEQSLTKTTIRDRSFGGFIGGGVGNMLTGIITFSAITATLITIKKILKRIFRTEEEKAKKKKLGISLKSINTRIKDLSKKYTPSILCNNLIKKSKEMCEESKKSKEMCEESKKLKETLKNKIKKFDNDYWLEPEKLSILSKNLENSNKKNKKIREFFYSSLSSLSPGIQSLEEKYEYKNNVPSDNVPSDNVPSDNVPSDNVPSDNVPSKKDIHSQICEIFSSSEKQETDNLQRRSSRGFLNRNKKTNVPSDNLQRKSSRGLLLWNRKTNSPQQKFEKKLGSFHTFKKNEKCLLFSSITKLAERNQYILTELIKLISNSNFLTSKTNEVKKSLQERGFQFSNSINLQT